jgi:hypothetical protein
MAMELFALFTIGILSSQAASLFSEEYTLGTLGDGIAGIAGAFFLGNVVSVVIGIPIYLGMFIGGVAATVLAWSVLGAAESLAQRHTH